MAARSAAAFRSTRTADAGSKWTPRGTSGAPTSTPGPRATIRPAPRSGKHIAVEGSCTSATDTSQPPDPYSGYFYFAPGGTNDPNVEVYDAEANHVGTLVTDGSLIFDNENHYLNTARDVAVDSSDHHAYVTDGGYGPHVAEFDTSRSQISTFGYESSAHNFGGLCDARGIAVDASTHDVYVADCNRIDVFGPGSRDLPDGHDRRARSGTDERHAARPR